MTARLMVSTWRDSCQRRHARTKVTRRLSARDASAKRRSPASSSHDAVVPGDYAELLAGMKQRIRQRQRQALQAVNHELVAFYWEPGESLSRKLEEQGWGRSVGATRPTQNCNRWLQKSAGPRIWSFSAAARTTWRANSICAPPRASVGRVSLFTGRFRRLVDLSTIRGAGCADWSACCGPKWLIGQPMRSKGNSHKRSAAAPRRGPH